MPRNPETGAEILDGPPAWFDEAQAALYPGEEPSDRTPLALIDPAEWQDQEPPERRWMVDGLVPHGQASLLTGAGSSGKSLVAQQMATCIALGRPWLGVDVEQAVSIYITCEDDTEELHRRQKAICDVMGVQLSALHNKLFVLSLAGMIDNELATFDERGRLHVADRFRDIEDAAQRVEARFVVMDNTGHFFSGNENDRHQVASFVNINNGLAARINGSVLIIGHPNKAGGEYSGSTAWENQVRSRLFMETPTDDDGNVADPDIRVITRSKSNYAQKGTELRFRWHKWAFVLDQELPDDQHAEMAANAQASMDNELFLKCLRERNKQRRQVSERPGANYAPKVFAKMPEAKGRTKLHLEAAMDRLFRMGAIERSFLYRDSVEGKDIHGLREVDGFSGNPQKSVTGNPPENTLDSKFRKPSGNIPETTGNPQKSYRKPFPETQPETNRKHLPETTGNPQKLTGNIPLYTPYIEGAPLEGGAPSSDCDPGDPPAWMDDAPDFNPDDFNFDADPDWSDE